MAIKSVKFKSPGTSVKINGQSITDENLTVDVYLRLMKASPNHEKLFTVERDEPEKPQTRSRNTKPAENE